MALLKFKYGPSANLATTAISDGVVYITNDSQEMKVDIGTTRHSISDFVIVETQAALDLIGTYYENLFYYVKADNLLKKYTKNPAEGETNWKNINDTSELESAISALGVRLLAVENTVNGYDNEGTHVPGLVDDLDTLEETVAGLDATKIETTKSFKVTAAVGNYKVGDTVNADDIQQILMDMLSKDVYPTRTQNASATLVLSNAGAKEVGSEFTPSFSFSTKVGQYTANGVTQSAGVTYNSFNVAESNRPDATEEGTSTSSSGSFTKFTVTDDTNYKLTGSCKSTEGAIPQTYLGNDYDVDDSTIDVRIEAKDWNNLSSSSVTGYRAMFYGYFDHAEIADPTQITSAQVRALSGVINTNTEASPRWETKTGPQTALPSGKKEVKTNKMQQMFFAAPAGKYSSIAVANSTNGAPQTVTKITGIKVEGANGYTTADYDVFYVSNAGAESGETIFDVTLS